MQVILLGAFILLAAADWWAVAGSRARMVQIFKPASLAALLLFALSAGAPPLVVAALVLSLLGDIYLMLPDELFGWGLASFLLAHLCYAAALPAAPESRLIWLGILAVLTLPVTTRLLYAASPWPLRTAVAAYVVVILIMAGSFFADGSPWGIAGASLFVASDSILAWNRFVARLRGANLIVMVTYHLGQLGLVLSFLST